MRTTAIFNYKGGVGKTTVTVNLAAELAAMGKRVVVLDADGQGNAGKYLGVTSEVNACCTYDLLSGSGEPYVENYLYRSSAEGVLCVPAGKGMMHLEMAASLGMAVYTAGFRDFRDALAEDGETDVLLIDCPPNVSPATAASLIAAEEVIVPVLSDAFSTAGIIDVGNQVAEMRTANPGLRILGLLLNRKTRYASFRDAEKYFRASRYPVFQTRISESAAIPRSTFQCRPLRLSGPWTKAAKDFEALAKEYLEGGASA